MRFLINTSALLLLVAPVTFGQCPPPDGTTVCDLSYDPVTCNGCTYDNLCIAVSAGQSEADCAPACAEPDSTVACTLDYNPVACGGFTWCLYSNLCLALAAGKTEADCIRSCPSLPETVVCTLEYEPYVCGGCFYDNRCLAEAAWGGAGLSMDSCTALSTLTVGSSACPTVPDGTACTADFAPQLCDGDCVYDNTCLADAAGATGCCPAVPDGTACTFDYVPQTCDNGCTYDNTCLAEAAGATGCSETCRVPDGTVACTLEYAPVVCGPGCFFANLCNGEAAGYTDCSLVCPSPPEGTACTANYAPTICHGCEFDNECLAEASGFDPATDCNLIATPAVVAATLCPTTSETVACTLDYNPVTCDGDCAYDNLCLAEAAGATNCVGSCPVPDESVVCTTEFAPVACGGTQWCLYSNLCEALAAGQQEIDCVRDCPTNTDDSIACTTEYDPVFCGGCVYPNECEATAAWVTSAGLPESSCVTISTLPAFADTCPTVPGVVACTADYRPQTCDGDCEYANVCLAEAAGATNCMDSCPLPDAEIMCTREYAPVICGGSCKYSNACLGTAAGFAAEDCSAVCPDPSTPAEGTACTLEYAPVFCQGCEFSNSCVAESLGFDLAVDCASITTTSADNGNGTDPGSMTMTSGATDMKNVMAVLVGVIMLVQANAV